MLARIQLVACIALLAVSTAMAEGEVQQAIDLWNELQRIEQSIEAHIGLVESFEVYEMYCKPPDDPNKADDLGALAYLRSIANRLQSRLNQISFQLPKLFGQDQSTVNAVLSLAENHHTGYSPEDPNFWNYLRRRAKRLHSAIDAKEQAVAAAPERDCSPPKDAPPKQPPGDPLANADIHEPIYREVEIPEVPDGPLCRDDYWALVHRVGTARADAAFNSWQASLVVLTVNRAIAAGSAPIELLRPLKEQADADSARWEDTFQQLDRLYKKAKSIEIKPCSDRPVTGSPPPDQIGVDSPSPGDVEMPSMPDDPCEQDDTERDHQTSENRAARNSAAADAAQLARILRILMGVVGPGDPLFDETQQQLDDVDENADQLNQQGKMLDDCEKNENENASRSAPPIIDSTLIGGPLGGDKHNIVADNDEWCTYWVWESKVMLRFPEGKAGDPQPDSSPAVADPADVPGSFVGPSMLLATSIVNDNANVPYGFIDPETQKYHITSGEGSKDMIGSLSNDVTNVIGQSDYNTQVIPVALEQLANNIGSDATAAIANSALADASSQESPNAIGFWNLMFGNFAASTGDEAIIRRVELAQIQFLSTILKVPISLRQAIDAVPEQNKGAIAATLVNDWGVDYDDVLVLEGQLHKLAGNAIDRYSGELQTASDQSHPDKLGQLDALSALTILGTVPFENTTDLDATLTSMSNVLQELQAVGGIDGSGFANPVQTAQSANNTITLLETLIQNSGPELSSSHTQAVTQNLAESYGVLSLALYGLAAQQSDKDAAVTIEDQAASAAQSQAEYREKLGQPVNIVFYVKASRPTMESGRNISKAAAGAHIKLTLDAPPLPLDGRRKVDVGFDADPVQGIAGPDGEIVLSSSSGNDGDLADLGWRDATTFAMNADSGATQAVVAGAAAATEPSVANVELSMPTIESYVVKLKMDRSKDHWDRPHNYLSDRIAAAVIRHWIVEDDMYVVLVTAK